jgi:hypothetical protein
VQAAQLLQFDKPPTPLLAAAQQNMGVITIEFADRNESDPCPCCGHRTTRLTRFVYSDGDAHAVYYAAWSPGHSEYVSVVVSLGEWGEGSTPEERVAFPLRIRSTKTEFQMGLVNAEQSPWSDADFLGRMLDRKESLRHPWLQEVFHITDHIVIEDADLREFLRNTEST